MATTTTVSNTTTSYVKHVDSAVTLFTLQNTGVRDIYVIFTEGAAPADTAKGLRIKPNNGVSRTHGTGHVYVRSFDDHNNSVLCVVQDAAGGD